MWKTNKIQKVDFNSLASLIDGRIPAIRIETFADSQESDALANGLLEHARRTSSIEQVTRLGISQYQQGVQKSQEHYFNLARIMDAEFSHIYAGSFSPVNRLITRLRTLGFDTDIMSEPDLGAYFAGNGKLRNGYSPVHVDYAPQDSAGWTVAEADAQLAWNLYLRIPPQGGELLLWDKLWQPEDDRYQVNHNYFYHDAVVKGVPMIRISVSPGDVVIINSRNFHAVSETQDRLAFGSFISCFQDGRLRLWS